MGSWIVWLVLAAVLGVAEIMTTTLAFGLIAVGAVVAAVVGVAGAGLPFQLGAFAVASAAGLGVVRPIAIRHIKQPPLLRTGTVGPGRPVREGASRKSPSDGGRVRIGGEVWSARPYDESLVIPAGSTVDVLRSRAPPHSCTRGSRHGNSRARSPPLVVVILIVLAGRSRPSGSCRRPGPGTSSGSAGTARPWNPG